MIGFGKKVAVVPLQSEASANYNPFPDTTTQVTDIQAIKTAFLADTEVLEALKGDDGQQGQQGPQGQTGPAGDSIIVMSTDPTDAISSKVGDLYLNTTTGTLYQRSGITQAQFFAAGLQGIVLPNSIWIRKGNLKGATGQDGTDGGKIYFDTENNIRTSYNLYKTTDIVIDENWNVYRRNNVPVYVPVPPQDPNFNQNVDVSYYFDLLGNIKGSNGADGQNGNKIYAVSQMPSNSTDVQIYENGDLIFNTTTGLLYERSNMTALQFLTQNSQTGLQGIVLAGVVFLTKGNLKGATGEKGDKGDTGVMPDHFLKGKKIAFYGDSITANNNIQPSIVSQFGIVANSYGISGTKIASTDNNSFNLQSRIDTVALENDYIIIIGGVNDFAKNVAIGNISDTDVATFYGGLKAMLERFTIRFPTKKIFICTPVTCRLTGLPGFNDVNGLINNLGFSLKDYCDAIINVARMYSVEVIDLNSQVGINQLNISTYISNEGYFVHPNLLGGQKIAKRLISRLHTEQN